MTSIIETSLIERYVKPDTFSYNFDNGPAEVPDEEAARQDGLNCIALAHLSIRCSFGYPLPSWMHCYEMFSDTTFFDTIGSIEDIIAGDLPIEDMAAGDLVWFGPDSPEAPLRKYVPQYDTYGALVNWKDNPVKHVAIYTGEEHDGDLLMLHADYEEGTNVVWPLQQFETNPRYKHVHRISRLASGLVIKKKKAQDTK